MRFWKYSNSENYLIFKHYFVEAWYTLHICGISVYEGKSVTFNHFDCNLNKKGSINVKFDFKISLIIISAVSVFWPNSVWWSIILVLRQRIICIDIQSNLWIENVCVKTAPIFRQRTFTYYDQVYCTVSFQQFCIKYLLIRQKLFNTFIPII